MFLTRRDLSRLLESRFARNCLLELKHVLKLGASFLFFDVSIQQDEYCFSFPHCDRLFAVYWWLSLLIKIFLIRLYKLERMASYSLHLNFVVTSLYNKIRIRLKL